MSLLYPLDRLEGPNCGPEYVTETKYPALPVSSDFTYNQLPCIDTCKVNAA